MYKFGQALFPLLLIIRLYWYVDLHFATRPYSKLQKAYGMLSGFILIAISLNIPADYNILDVVSIYAWLPMKILIIIWYRYDIDILSLDNIKPQSKHLIICHNFDYFHNANKQYLIISDDKFQERDMDYFAARLLIFDGLLLALLFTLKAL